MFNNFFLIILIARNDQWITKFIIFDKNNLDKKCMYGFLHKIILTLHKKYFSILNARMCRRMSRLCSCFIFHFRKPRLQGHVCDTSWRIEGENASIATAIIIEKVKRQRSISFPWEKTFLINVSLHEGWFTINLHNIPPSVFITSVVKTYQVAARLTLRV